MPEDPASLRPAVFFDRDNTLMKVGGEYVGDPKDVVLMNGAAETVAGARHMGFATVVISNQSGVARGFFTEKDVRAVNRRLDEVLRERDRRAVIDRHEFCPHHPAYGVAPYRQACQCRKPRDGMLRRAAVALKLDLEKSWLIGDAPRDVEAGHSAGLRTILLRPRGVEPSPAAIAETRVAPDYEAHSLREALWIIAREDGKQLPALSAEEGELDELEDHGQADEFDPDELSLAEAYEDAISDSRATQARKARSEVKAQSSELTAQPEGALEYPAPLTAAQAPAAGGTGSTAQGLAGAEALRAVDAGAASELATQRTASVAPEVDSEREDLRAAVEAETRGVLGVVGWLVQVAALGLAGWAAYPALDQNRLLLAIFAQLFALTLLVASRR